MYEALPRQAAAFGLTAEEQATPTHELEHGQRYEFGTCAFDVRFTPGHAPGHVIFVAEDESVAISGDVVFMGSIGRTDLPGGDLATAHEVHPRSSSYPAGRDRALEWSWPSDDRRPRAYRKPLPGTALRRGAGVSRALKAAAFASGGGTNLQALIDHQRAKTPWTLALLVCNREGAGALRRAEAAGVASAVIPTKDREPSASG